ncbi:hypothetical protein Tco_1026338, partial [Tanacetum coccineum]
NEDEEEDVHRRFNDQLIVNEYVDLTKTHKEIKSKNVDALIEIRKREVKLWAQEVKMHEAAQRRQEMPKRRQEFRFYLQPHDHLSGPQLEMALDMKRTIKECWNLLN